MKEQEKQNQMPPVSSRHQKFSIERKIVQDDIRTKIKAMNKNISPALLAQFEDGVSGMQYIQEGMWIMQDVQLLIENVK